MAEQPTSTPSQRFTIVPGEWYGWTMWPGYCGEPYHSPIEALSIRAYGNGSGRFDLEFFNAGYAQGVQRMEYMLRTLVRQQTYLLATVDGTDRAVAIVPLSLRWCEAHVPNVHERLRVLIGRDGYSLTAAIRRMTGRD